MRQRSGGFWFLVAAVAAGLMAAVLTLRAIDGRESRVTVWVAKRTIEAFAEFRVQDFEAVPYPAQVVPADAVREIDVVAGRFARTLILEGTLLRSSHVASSEPRSAVAARLTEARRPGHRALALPIDAATGVGGTVMAGDRVDIIAAVTLNSPGAGNLPFAKVMARGVTVLYAEPPTDTGRRGTVVLEVTPELAEEIAFAQMAGSVYLATNPYDADLSAAETQGMTPERFMEKYGIQLVPTGG